MRCFIKLNCKPLNEFFKNITIIMFAETGDMLRKAGFATQKKLVAVHSFSNKLTGALMFILPLSLPLVDIAYSGGIACAVATFAAVEEGHFIRTGDRTVKRSFDK